MPLRVDPSSPEAIKEEQNAKYGRAALNGEIQK